MSELREHLFSDAAPSYGTNPVRNRLIGSCLKKLLRIPVVSLTLALGAQQYPVQVAFEVWQWDEQRRGPVDRDPHGEG